MIHHMSHRTIFSVSESQLSETNVLPLYNHAAPGGEISKHPHLADIIIGKPQAFREEDSN